MLRRSWFESFKTLTLIFNYVILYKIIIDFKIVNYPKSYILNTNDVDIINFLNWFQANRNSNVPHLILFNWVYRFYWCLLTCLNYIYVYTCVIFHSFYLPFDMKSRFAIGYRHRKLNCTYTHSIFQRALHIHRLR